jgi:AcrR family transcriptional regulator
VSNTSAQRRSAESGPRRTQAERRAESRQAVLDSATRLFGGRGYADTSLEDIAADCGLTIRPIYHYFGNKQALFAAVNDVMEERILDAMQVGEGGASLEDNWRAYLDLCDDPAFRRIVLIDSPIVLGRERWASSPVSEKARESLGKLSTRGKAAQFRRDLINTVFLAAFTEAALSVAEAEDIAMAKREAQRVMASLFSLLRES